MHTLGKWLFRLIICVMVGYIIGNIAGLLIAWYAYHWG